MDLLAPLARAFNDRHVRYVVIGVGGANYWAHSAGVVFTTQDRDVFLPPDTDNLVAAWSACEAAGFELWLVNEPLDRPRDRWLADRVIQRRALTRAMSATNLQVDLTLVMKGFDFDCRVETCGWQRQGQTVPRDAPRCTGATAETDHGMIHASAREPERRTQPEHEPRRKNPEV